jgi:hypothetical protein
VGSSQGGPKTNSFSQYYQVFTPNALFFQCFLGVDILPSFRYYYKMMKRAPRPLKDSHMAILRNLVQDNLDELNRLRAENAQLKKKTNLTMKVGNAGGVSVYGMGRFPVTLYKSQWEKLLENADDIRAFIKLHDSELAVKA